ncbi:MAG: [Fe-Fe] hydrogenase large subunit C-terminal domain-containing protein [Syntrophaceae bacterium]
MSDPIISTNPARCRDCYRCVRSCDVKAIRIKDHQAQIVQELCILCGTCVRVCPQKAKSIRSDRQAIIEAREAGKRVVASVAPSAPAFFDMPSFQALADAIKALGFEAVQETAVGARMVGLAHGEYVAREPQRHPVIASACPVVVNLVERYYPDLIPHLAPIVSPMIAHGRLLKRIYGENAFIVFIGPCIAKKQEMEDEAVSGAIQAVMTFRGLKEWFDHQGIQCRREPEPELGPPLEKARLFALEGGLIGTARMNTDILGTEMIMTSGLDACQDILKDIRSGELKAGLVELLACRGGCVNGPAMADMADGIYLARQRVMEFGARHQPDLSLKREDWPDLERGFLDRHVPVPVFSEAQIREVLRRVNKFTEEDELNCGACGYHTCRDKAVATLRGLAEITMCIPYMRQRSESLRQVVMEATPNAILIFNQDLIIQDLSPSAEKIFNCSLPEVQGQPLSSLIPIMDDFVRVRDTGESMLGKTRRLREDLVVEQTIVCVQGQGLMLAILKDVTERENERERFNQLRTETLNRTREVVSKQMRVAHEIAHLLGETTAESKTIFSHLARLLEEEDHS